MHFSSLFNFHVTFVPFTILPSLIKGHITHLWHFFIPIFFSFWAILEWCRNFCPDQKVFDIFLSSISYHWWLRVDLSQVWRRESHRSPVFTLNSREIGQSGIPRDRIGSRVSLKAPFFFEHFFDLYFYVW